MPPLNVCYIRTEDAVISLMKSVVEKKMLTETQFRVWMTIFSQIFGIRGSPASCSTPRGDISYTNKIDNCMFSTHASIILNAKIKLKSFFHWYSKFLYGISDAGIYSAENNLILYPDPRFVIGLLMSFTYLLPFSKRWATPQNWVPFVKIDPLVQTFRRNSFKVLFEVLRP